MIEDTTHSDLVHALSKLHSAQRSVERVGRMKTVKENLGYLIDDVQSWIKELEALNDKNI